MSFTLITTPSATNANGYADLDTALARAEEWIEGASFVALEDEDKQSQLLATSARRIDSWGRSRFVGAKASSTQSMQQPRDSDAVIPSAIVDATVLYAFILADQLTLGTIGAAVPETGQIKSEQIGPIKTEYFALPSFDATALSALPAEVQLLLEDQLVAAPTDADWAFEGTTGRYS